MKVIDTPLYPWSTRELPNIRGIADFKWYVKERPHHWQMVLKVKRTNRAVSKEKPKDQFEQEIDNILNKEKKRSDNKRSDKKKKR